MSFFFVDFVLSLSAHLCVGESKATQVSWHLQTKSSHLLQSLHGVVLHLLQSVILSRVIHLLAAKKKKVFFSHVSILCTDCTENH